MTRTGNQLIQGLSQFVDDYFISATTSAGNSSGTTLIDTALKEFGDNRMVGGYIRQNDTPYAVRRISSNTQSTGTVTVPRAFAAQVGSGVAYEYHKYDPVKKFRALDKARLDCVDYVFQIKLDDTITSDGGFVYDIPSAIEQGPHVVYEENPVSPNTQWNFLADPIGDSTDSWTASSTTATVVTRDDNDLIIPKYDYQCTKLVTAATTAATYTQVVGSMTNDITASLAADRKMTFAAWVYCTEASKIALRILDDSGTLATGSQHGGGGWQLLTVEGTVAGNNATTLSAQFVISSTANASTIYWNRAWFYFGSKERVADEIYSDERTINVRRDDTLQHIILATRPTRGRQLRLAGKAPLSALGALDSTQITNSMEVNEKSQEIIIAYAAELLFMWEGISSDSVPEIVKRIENVRARIPGLQRAWEMHSPKPFLRSPFAR